MHRVLCLIVTSALSMNSHAQSQKARELEELCTTEDGRVACLWTVKAFMDGFIEGVGKGVLDTYAYDDQLGKLVKNAKLSDLVPRMEKVVERSTCIQKIPVKDVAAAFVQFVQKHPEMRNQSYRKVLTRSIVWRYCK